MNTRHVSLVLSFSEKHFHQSENTNNTLKSMGQHISKYQIQLNLSPKELFMLL